MLAIDFRKVHVVATTNVNIATGLSTGNTVGGAVLEVGWLVLLTGQTAPAENGVYEVPRVGSAPRHKDYKEFDFLAGANFSIMLGTSADTRWQITSNPGGVLGVTAIVASIYDTDGDEGPVGPEGPQGPVGPAGPTGAQGLGVDTFLGQANTFTEGPQVVQKDVAGALWILRSADGTPDGGPHYRTERLSPTPLALDKLGGLRVLGNDSGGNLTAYALLEPYIKDPTGGVEAGGWGFKTAVGGVDADAVGAIRIRIESGLFTADQTDPGVNKIAASEFVDDGVALLTPTQIAASYFALANLDPDATAAANSDTRAMSQKAAKTLAATYTPLTTDANNIKKDGSVAMTSDLSLGTFKITGLGTPSAGTDAATKAYADSVAAAVTPHTQVRFVAFSGSLATDFENGDTYDGLLLVTGDRFLYQPLSGGIPTPGTTVGLYTVPASGAAPRATDLDVSGEFTPRPSVAVTAGTHANSKWVCTNTTNPTLGVDNITFQLDSSAAAYAADGTTMSLVGSTFSVGTIPISKVTSLQADLDAKALAARTLTGQGLVAAIGNLTADRNVNVPKASTATMETGTNDTEAATPLGVAAAVKNHKFVINSDTFARSLKERFGDYEHLSSWKTSASPADWKATWEAATAAAHSRQVRLIVPAGEMHFATQAALPANCDLEIICEKGALFTTAAGLRAIWSDSTNGLWVYRLKIIGARFDGEAGLDILQAISVDANPAARSGTRFQMVDCEVINTSASPCFIKNFEEAGCFDSTFKNTKDPAFVFCQSVWFQRNKNRHGHDNGVSITRGNRRVFVSNNLFEDQTGHNIFISGYNTAGSGGATARLHTPSDPSWSANVQGTLTTTGSDLRAFMIYQRIVLRAGADEATAIITAVAGVNSASVVFVDTVPASLRDVAVTDYFLPGAQYGPTEVHVHHNTAIGGRLGGMQFVDAPRLLEASHNLVKRPGITVDVTTEKTGRIAKGSTSLILSSVITGLAVGDYILVKAHDSQSDDWLAKVASGEATTTVITTLPAPDTFWLAPTFKCHTLEDTSPGIGLYSSSVGANKNLSQINILDNTVEDFIRYGLEMGDDAFSLSANIAESRIKVRGLVGSRAGLGAIPGFGAHALVHIVEGSASELITPVILDDLQFFGADNGSNAIVRFDQRGAAARDHLHLGSLLSLSTPAVQTIRAFDLDNASADVSSVYFYPRQIPISRMGGTLVFNPVSMNDGTGQTAPNMTVTGATLGDHVRASFSLDLQGVILHGWVSSANTVKVRFQNESGVTVDLGSGTITVWVIPK